jgi:hypothetical protein
MCGKLAPRVFQASAFCANDDHHIHEYKYDQFVIVLCAHTGTFIFVGIQTKVQLSFNSIVHVCVCVTLDNQLEVHMCISF